MKHVSILFVVFIIFSASAISQKSAPENIKKEFARKYPAAQNVKWGSEEANEWEAEFKMNGKEMSASYDNAGKWLETETGVALKELPAAVTSAIKKEFAGYKTGEMSIIESPGLKGYEIALKKGETALEVIFDNNGIVLKKTEVKEK
jgi:Putative beta-lactamase-inhibitor-like, PepSY-like